MTDNGFILLSRSILDSDVFASQKLLKIWIWCLCKANFKDRTIPFKFGKGEQILSVKRGSFIFGRNKAEEELFIDASTIYKSIQKLKELEMIKIESNNQYSIITICKYDEYQNIDNYTVTSKEQVSNKKVTSKEQVSNTTKKDNKDKNEKNIYRQFAHLKITIEENQKILESGYAQNEINDIYDSIENYKKNTNYTSLYLTTLKWLKKERENKIQKAKIDKIEIQSINPAYKPFSEAR